MYRLTIDCELSEDQALSIQSANSILEYLRNADTTDNANMLKYGGFNFKVRLQRDEDRSVKNYLTINENGHAGRAKINLFE